ncbi:MAG: YgcG family protein [Betaproteobacteria bacterium]|nr:YgcG family protein [Betaproteobacteria bacterium]
MPRAPFAVFAAFLLLCFAGLAGAQELQPVPELSARVTDLTATLAVDRRERMEAKLAAFEREKGAQIVVLLVPSVKPETVEQYALRVVEAWKVGRKGVDDGALLLVAKQDRKLRIEVGYGLEGALNDATAKRIVSETIGPRFKEGDFAGGIDAGLEAMMKAVGGEALPAPGSSPSADGGSELDTLIPVALIAVFVVGGILRSIFGRFIGAGIVGAAVGFIASLLVSSLLLAGVIGVIAFFFSLLAGAAGGGGWSSGGGSWSAGSGGSGGFSGGGGSFGGGGASGDW